MVVIVGTKYTVQLMLLLFVCYDLPVLMLMLMYRNGHMERVVAPESQIFV